MSLAEHRMNRGREPWVNAQAVADHFGVTTRTVIRWRSLGMPSHKPEFGQRRYRISECDAWFRDR